MTAPPEGWGPGDPPWWLLPLLVVGGIVFGVAAWKLGWFG
jgi:hypothetical protein